MDETPSACLELVLEASSRLVRGAEAPCHAGALVGVARLVEAGWRAVAITARPAHLGGVTRQWLRAHGLRLEAVHHTALGKKHELARELGVVATIEDNPMEAETLAEAPATRETRKK